MLRKSPPPPPPSFSQIYRRQTATQYIFNIYQYFCTIHIQIFLVFRDLLRCGYLNRYHMISVTIGTRDILTLSDRRTDRKKERERRIERKRERQADETSLCLVLLLSSSSNNTTYTSISPTLESS